MSLKHALLGFLNYGPMTGYELKKFFDNSVSHFWSAELSQIYPSLKQLEAEGLIEMQIEVQEDRPNRKVCSITDDGREELLRWMAEPAESEQVREPILIKIFFGSSMPRSELLRVLQQRKQALTAYREDLNKSEMLIHGFTREVGLEREAAFWRLTTLAGIKHCQAEAEWVDEAKRTLEQMNDDEFGHLPPYGTPHPDGEMDVRTAVEILERLKGLVEKAVAANSK